MIQFVCDSCRRVKAHNEIWILGLAAEALGITAARREVNILSAWDRENAVHPFAVHFCSEECKNRYMEQLFGEPEEVEEIEEMVAVAAPKTKRVTTARTTKVSARRKKRAA